jgi:death-on-curing protein
MEVFLNLNGFELSAHVDEQEQLFLTLAAGGSSREKLQEWLEHHTKPTDH